MIAVSVGPARTPLSPRIHVYALLCAIVLVPLANYPGHLVWFDVTPKVAALILLVGLACVTIPSTLLDQATGRKCVATFIPMAMIVIAVLSAALSRTPL